MEQFDILEQYLEDRLKKDLKVLLLLKNRRNADLLEKFLGKYYLTYSKIDKDIQYDLILVDTYNYQAYFEEIKDLKINDQSSFLPILLLYKRDDIIDYTGKMMNIADEYILTPVRKDVLKNRVKRLLDTRIMSKKAHYFKKVNDCLSNNISNLVLIFEYEDIEKTDNSLIYANQTAIEAIQKDKEQLKKIKLSDLIEESSTLKLYIKELKAGNKVIFDKKLNKLINTDRLFKIKLLLIELYDRDLISAVIIDNMKFD